MSKMAKKSLLAGNEAIAKAKVVRSSARKLNLVAQLIRNMPAAKAMVELEFNQRRVAQDVRRVLAAAIANAENNFNLDVDKLFVKEASVGRAFVLKRFHARARGRASQVEKSYSNLRIIVAERAEEDVKAKPVKAEKAKAKKSVKQPASKKV